LLEAVFLKRSNSADGSWADLDFYAFFILQWFIGVFAYFLLRKDADWVRPVFSLWVLMTLTLVGPLSPSSLSIDDHEHTLKMEMTEVGMLKDGLLVKLPVLPDHATLSQIQSGLYWLAQNEGLNCLRPSFPPELRDLNWNKGNPSVNFQHLLDWLGREPTNPNPYVTQKRFSIETRVNTVSSPASSGVKQLGDEEIQDFNFFQGQVVPSRNPGYFLGFPNQTQFLILYFDGQPLGEISLESMIPKLVHYDVNDILRSQVKPKDMVLEYKNKKVKLKLFFSNLVVYTEDGKRKIRMGSGTLLAKRK
jgi:hypothetical protein